MENENQSRREKIEQFLLDPDKVILEMLEGLDESTKELIEALRGVDLEKLEALRGEDGKTPERGIDYFTDEDLDNIEAYINSRIPKAKIDYPTPEQVNLYVDKKVKSEVSKLPLQKGDKGTPGKNGEPGKNGSPDTAEQIIEKLRSLPKNKRLNVSDIRGLQTEINKLIESNQATYDDLVKIIESLKITIPSISSGGMSECNWGNIGGDLDNQTDLKAVLDTKLEDIAGLITAGANVSITGSGTTADPFVINAIGSGSGDVTGPAGAVSGNLPEFDGLTGKIIKDSGKKVSDFQLALGYTAENVSNKKISLTDNSDTYYPSQKAVKTAVDAKEDVANKSTNVVTDGASDTKYPSVKAIKDYADGLVAGLLDYRGGYDASVNTFPASGGSGTAGAVLKGDMWIISVAGTLGGTAVQVGDSVIANVDTPAQTAGNWNVLNSNISYVPEDVANKVTSLSGSSTDTQYPSAKLLYDQLAGKQATLVSGINIKTINSTSLLGSGDIEITGGGGIEVGSTTSTATPSIDVDSYNRYSITALATAITSVTITGTPTNFQELIIRIKDNGTARTIAWGSSFEAKGVALPLTTVVSKVLTVKFIYDTVTSKWGCVAYTQEA